MASVIVSISGIQQFERCQRQWCFDKRFASAQAKNHPLRREAYILSQFQSIAAWRGNLVDQVISSKVIPALLKGWMIRRELLLAHARSIFDKQLAFALRNRVREPGMTKEEDSFAALAIVEYGDGIDKETKAQAWLDVERALTNLLEMDELCNLLRSASKLITQRPLIYPHFQVHFRAVPDLIVFFDDAAPLIVDWKVHAKGIQDYRLQLFAYAVALTRCKPHKDFPASLSRWSATDIRLLEVQLLTKQQRAYQPSEDDIADIDDYVAEAAAQMVMAVDGRSTREVDPFDFPVTANPERCQWCTFHRICSEETKCQEPEQMTLL